jgi:hypothetical protein
MSPKLRDEIHMTTDPRSIRMHSGIIDKPIPCPMKNERKDNPHGDCYST